MSVTKIHGPTGLTDLLNAPDPGLAAFGDGQSNASTVSPTAVLAASAVPTQVLYLAETAGTNAINVADINQGQLGDCFLLSPIGEMALLKPTSISNMIHVNANGTETVMLYVASNGRLPTWGTTAFKAVSETINNVFPNYSVDNGATQDVLKGQKEIWPQVLEKAVATLDGGYGAIANGGSPLIAMEELTGHAATFMSPASLTLAALQSFVAAGDLIVMDTRSDGALPNGLFNNHAYMFEGVTGSGATALAHFGNPWGFDQPTAMLVSQLSRGFTEVDIGHLS
jgi:Calpain family cysteine protease